MRRPDKDRNGDGAVRTPLRPFLLIGLAAVVYLGLEIVVFVYKSWLLAGAVLAAGMAAFWAIWPATDEDDAA